MSKAGRSVGDLFKTTIAGRLALVGLASVLIFLSGFSIWGARTTNEAAETARTSKRLSDLYDRARFSVAEQRSLERQYRLRPYSGTRELFTQNSLSFVEYLTEINRIGDRSDLELVERMSGQHVAYKDAIRRLFHAVDTGRTRLVERIAEKQIDPVFSDIEERVYTASFHHEAEASKAFGLLEETEAKVRLGTLMAFGAGLALLAMLVFVDHRRRLQEGEERFRSMVRSSSDVIVIIQEDGTVVYQSRPFDADVEKREVVGLKLLDLVSQQDRPMAAEFMKELDRGERGGGRERSIETRLDGAGDSATCFEVVGNNLVDNPNVAGIVLTLRDVTERKQAEKAHQLLEAQLRQSQKMDAIGQLAGGVAHDFNNLISIILNYTRFSIEGMGEEDQRRLDMQEVIRAGEQAANLTRQLLAFSRKEVAQPTDFIVNDVVVEVENMLRRVLGEQVAFETALDPQLSYIRADRSQMQQIIMNLCVNARDAMVAGGKLVLETSNEEVEGSLDEPELKPGRYACLTVSDTGVGISEDVRARIFEPFYTTKERESGTGLGLSTVYGIAAQAGGHVTVQSELGVGTTFKVYLPAVGAPSRDEAEGAQTDNRDETTETILLAEDEDAVREMVRRMLSRRGYRVLVASSAKEALSILRSETGKIDILLTDVVMPGLSGKELATLAKGIVDDLKVVFMSGYTDDIIARQGVLHEDEMLLQKPFTDEELFAKLAEALVDPVRHQRFEQSPAQPLAASG